MRTVDAAYFSGPTFAAPATGELLAHYTCLGCANRSTTWTAFRAHRRDCAGRLPAGVPLPAAAAPPSGARLTADDLDALDDLAARLGWAV